jgi:hypothetical protein
MKARESGLLANTRLDQLNLVQEHYSSFVPFLEDVMEELGFTTTDIQRDIGGYIAYGPQYLMVQAQRSQAKTTIAAAFAVWYLIHNPTGRVLIVSAGGKQATDISTLIVRLIMNMDVLECMRPDKAAGDRTSVEGFDLHHSIKGIDKSASVDCVGIDANLQGRRADLLIPDDIESSKNSATPTQRAKLLHLTKDFTSINGSGRIIWLGTPQTMESIYNSLPGRGVTVRIWPGRYPTPEQMEHYGSNLAPLIAQRLARNPSLATGGGLLGDQGMPVDDQLVGLLDEAALQKKERDQGQAYFQLQHMLNTAMMDALKYPLKTERLVVIESAGGNFPLAVVRGMTSDKLRDYAAHEFSFKLTVPHSVSPEVAKLQSVVCYIDPAGGGANADETAYAIGGFLNGNVYLLAVGGIPGGYENDKMNALAARIKRFADVAAKPMVVKIEKNMGYGAFRAVFTPVLRKELPSAGIEDDMVTGQKEARIINTLEPVIGRGSLIVTEAAIREDLETSMHYQAALRLTYSFFYQLSKMCRVRNALVHDDRIDAVEGLVRHFNEALSLDQKKQLAALAAKAHAEAISDPLGYNRYDAPTSKRSSMLKRRR